MGSKPYPYECPNPYSDPAIRFSISSVGGWRPLQTAVAALRAALEARVGTAEQLAALFVALLRAGGLEARSLRRASSLHGLKI